MAQFACFQAADKIAGMTMATETPEIEVTPSSEGTPGQSSRASSTAPASSRRRPEWIVLAGLIVVLLTQLWSSVVQLSITSDEIDHLHAAYRYWHSMHFSGGVFLSSGTGCTLLANARDKHPNTKSRRMIRASKIALRVTAALNSSLGCSCCVETLTIPLARS